MSEIQQLIDGYLETCRTVRRLSANTISAYKSDLAQFVAGLSSDKELMPQSIRACLTNFAEDARLSPTTVKRKVAAIRAFLRAVNEELALKTFASWKLSIRMPVRLPRSIPAGDLATLVRFAKSEPNRPEFDCLTTHMCISLLAATGLRISELCALSIGDVRRTGEVMVAGKGARERVVMIANQDLRKALTNYIDMLPDRSKIGSPLFRNHRGRPMTSQCFRLRLHDIARRSKVDRRVTPHMLRYTAATLLLEGGVDTRFVQRLLGHASIATTQIYTYVSDVALRRALEHADVMRPIVGGTAKSISRY